MTSDQRSFLSKALLPISLYCVGLAAVCTISAIWGIAAHAFWIDVVALAFSYTVALAVLVGALRAANEADRSEPSEARTPSDSSPHMRQAA